MFQSQKEASSFSWPFFFHSCHAALKPSWNLVMSAFLVLKLTVHSPRQIVPVLDHFRDKFHLFFAKNVIHHQTNKLSYQIPSRWKLLVFWLNLLLAFLASSHQTGRLVVNLLTKISHPLFIRSPEAVSSFRDDRAQRGGRGYYSCPSMKSAASEEEGYIGVIYSCHQVVHWNAPHEEILSFSVWRHGLFLSRDVHSKGVYVQEEKLSALFVVSNGSRNPFRICPDHNLSQLINSGHADSSLADKNHS